MIYSNQHREMRRATGEPSGGGGGPATGSPTAGQGGASESTPDNTIADPFAGIDFDDLDPDVRAVMEKGKTQFATLQKQLETAASERTKAEQLSRQFQSKLDSQQAQLNRLVQGQSGPQETPEEQARLARLEKMTKILVARNVPEAQARVQAEIMAEMMGEFSTAIKGEIGRELAPFANSVVQRDAESAWNAALQSDKVGALSIPQVAEKTLAQVQVMIDRGQQVTPAVVKNLCGMMYLEHLESGGQPAPGATPQSMTPSTPSLPNFGRPAFTGHSPAQPPRFDPNAPKHTLDSATDAALQTVMSKWEVKPKSFRPTGR